MCFIFLLGIALYCFVLLCIFGKIASGRVLRRMPFLFVPSGWLAATTTARTHLDFNEPRLRPLDVVRDGRRGPP
jgi:hypothetical protein